MYNTLIHIQLDMGVHWFVPKVGFLFTT